MTPADLIRAALDEAENCARALRHADLAGAIAAVNRCRALLRSAAALNRWPTPSNRPTADDDQGDA